MLIKNNHETEPDKRQTSSALTRVPLKQNRRIEGRNVTGIDAHVKNWRPQSSLQYNNRRKEESHSDSQEIFLELESHIRTNQSRDVSKSSKVLETRLASMRKTDLNSTKLEDETSASPQGTLLPTRKAEQYHINKSVYHQNLASVRLSKQQAHQNFVSQASMSRNKFR